MPSPLAAVRAQLTRQVVHWSAAMDELGDLGRFASPAAWKALERYLDTAVESALRRALDRLRRQCDVLKARLAAAETEHEIAGVRRELLAFRRRYLAVETMLDFYGDAINTRTNPALATYLSACDSLARESLQALLTPLGIATPPVLTYLDKGLGASILKAGLRLWDGRSVSPVAAIRLVRHNLHRPTSLLHETGHQAAHLTGWVPELAAALEAGLSGGALGRLWAGWASEIAADAYAFVHTGYASLAALHDVLAGDADSVLRVQMLDPHPTGYVRVLLGHGMCRRFFGAGPWDTLAAAWTHVYHVGDADEDSAALLTASTVRLPAIVEIVLERSYRAFRGRSLVERIDPSRVRPDALEALARAGGGALYRSSDWVRRECLRLLALSGYRAATAPEQAREVLREQDEWMNALGRMATAA
jgi:hypothetical protein